MQRCFAALGTGIDIGPMLQELTHHLSVAVLRADHKGGRPTVHPPIYIGLVLQQILADRAQRVGGHADLRFGFDGQL